MDEIRSYCAGPPPDLQKHLWITPFPSCSRPRLMTMSHVPVGGWVTVRPRFSPNERLRSPDHPSFRDD
jgi:hypothetical protein